MKPRNIFQESVKVIAPNKSAFDLSHEKKLSCDMGYLVPILYQEVMPGDTFKSYTEIMMRLAPMISPVMHRVNVFTHSFYCPYRIIFNEWEDFITGGKNGTTNPGFPKIHLDYNNVGYTNNGTLADYMGVPKCNFAPGGESVDISALPFRAYQEIYNEYYRDQNLSDPIAFSKAATLDSGDAARLLTLRKRAWEKDYFTSALPWAQRGPESVAPLKIDYMEGELYMLDGETPIADGDLKSGGGYLASATSEATILKNIEETSGITINTLRQAVKLQEWLEKNARGGARYIEQIWQHFKVKSSDARLQRPEYLGGSKNAVVISEVLNTTGTTENPQGNMSGHGISSGGSNGWSRTFEEHGCIITVMSVLPRTAYQQGLPVMLRKFDKFDFAWPEFAQLGEQPVKMHELYYDGTAALDETAFGYQQRYAEYKFNNSTVHGDFKNTLEFWHMGRVFDEAPELNENFVMSDPTQRIFAVENSNNKLYVQLYNKITAIRPLPYNNIPSIL